MTYRQAIKLDQKGGFYAEFDNASGCWGVFGTESGFCYELVSEGTKAIDLASEMNNNRYR